MLSPPQNAVLADLFRLLGDQTRLRIVFVCLDRPSAVAEIAESLALSPALVTQHLSQLEDANLVLSERQGKTLLFCAREPVRIALKAMVGLLSESPGAEQGFGDAGPVADAARR